MRRTVSIKAIVALALLLWATSGVRAADGQPRKIQAELSSAKPELTYAPQWPEPPDTGALLLRLGIGTVTVLALCVGTMWFGRRWLKHLPGGVAGCRKLQIEDVLTLGNRAALYLVKVGETQLVVGTDAGGMKSLLALPHQFKEALEEQLGSEKEAG
ncbi:MAG: flagellar biosynthetic protein FliO, partial [Planctomycetales bacterium]|nr:flagellar biosynthetic protein FliO [Planctomycetales bacterium]